MKTQSDIILKHIFSLGEVFVSPNFNFFMKMRIIMSAS